MRCPRTRPLERQPGTRWCLSFTGLTISTHSPSAQPGCRCNSQPNVTTLYTLSVFIVCKAKCALFCRPLPYRPAARLTTSTLGKSRKTASPTPAATATRRQRQREIHFSVTFQPP